MPSITGTALLVVRGGLKSGEYYWQFSSFELLEKETFRDILYLVNLFSPLAIMTRLTTDPDLRCNYVSLVPYCANSLYKPLTSLFSLMLLWRRNSS